MDTSLILGILYYVMCFLIGFFAAKNNIFSLKDYKEIIHKQNHLGKTMDTLIKKYSQNFDENKGSKND